ncbi:exopolysaccharide production repressor protein [Mesorhizobium sp. PUT5]|uniref:exopolysaccharide production repressor protein n=1 Tax=Mesorhizobium sp. PUT5 TaxID=3454629 RepID=UPI003FA46153
MSFPLFLRGFVIAMLAFAIASYAITQSAWTTVLNTVICGVLIQIGYFMAVLFMLWRSGAPGRHGDRASSGKGAVTEVSGEQEGKTSSMPGVGRSRLP